MIWNEMERIGMNWFKMEFCVKWNKMESFGMKWNKLD